MRVQFDFVFLLYTYFFFLNTPSIFFIISFRVVGKPFPSSVFSFLGCTSPNLIFLLLSSTISDFIDIHVTTILTIQV